MGKKGDLTSVGCLRRNSLRVLASPAAAAATMTAGFSRRERILRWSPMSSLSSAPADSGGGGKERDRQ